jgi:4-aminobutyrate aminotransferase-like enzyme
MKYMKDPGDVDEITAVTGEKVVNRRGEAVKGSFKVFILGRLTEQAFGTGMEAVLSAQKIAKAAEEMNGILAIEDADYKNLEASVKLGTYDPQTAINHIPYMKAVTEASDEKPEEEKSEASEEKTE